MRGANDCRLTDKLTTNAIVRCYLYVNVKRPGTRRAARQETPVDMELSDEQLAFAQAAREFAQGELAPHAARWDQEGIFPIDAFRKAGEMGFCAIYASEDIGGLGLPRLDATLVFEEMAAVDPSTAAFLTINNMATWMIGNWAAESVRSHWGHVNGSRRQLASYALTEPGAGSDAASLTTRAELQGDHYVLNGAKAFISGAGDTDVLVVMARTGGVGAGGVSAFVVPARLPGITYGERKARWGGTARAHVPSRSRMCAFRSTIVWARRAKASSSRCADSTEDASASPLARSVPRRVHWTPRGLHGRAQAIQSGAGGLSGAAVQIRRYGGHTVAARAMVRLAACKLGGARLMRQRIARWPTPRHRSEASGVPRRPAVAWRIRVSEGLPLERLVRDSRSPDSLEGTNEIMRVIIARQLLKKARTYDE